MPDNNTAGDSDSDQGSKLNKFPLTRRSALIGAGGAAIGGALGSVADRTTPEETSTDTERSEERTLEGLEASVGEVLSGDKFGKLKIDQYTHTLQISGTRQPAWLVQPFHEDVTTTSTSYEDTDANIGYGMIPFPPGQVPVLRAVTHFENDSDSTTSLRISIANRLYPEQMNAPLDEGPVKRTILEVTGKGSTQVYDETYLSDHKDIVVGMPNGSPHPVNSFIIEVKTSNSDRPASVLNTTTVSLELEAL